MSGETEPTFLEVAQESFAEQVREQFRVAAELVAAQDGEDAECHMFFMDHPTKPFFRFYGIQGFSCHAAFPVLLGFQENDSAFLIHVGEAEVAPGGIDFKFSREVTPGVDA